MTKQLIPALLLLISGTLSAQDSHFQSGVERNRLIELYTSEGCSSCPPAESWLNQLRRSPALWHDLVPVAFHVDYWDHLGWEDRFAAAAYSARQRAYARHLRARTIYTPAFFVNGHEWRRWADRHLPGKHSSRVGNLTVQVQDGSVSARFQPAIPLPQQLVLHIARLGMNRHTEIRAGERAGEKVTHHFVVLGHKSVSGDHRRWQTALPPSRHEQTGREALAVWVTPADNPLPVQAVGGYLP